MKKVLVTIATLMAAQSTFAANLMCGANSEKVKGSQVYDKPVFWVQNAEEKNQMRFLLPDGTVVDGIEAKGPELLQLPKGTIAMSISFSNGKVSLSVSKVKKDALNHIRFQDQAVAGSFGKEALLFAHGVTVMCKEY